jgi:hypothetical protein
MDNSKLLDGTVEEVKAGLAGLDAATLGDLLATEQAGKNRKGVIDAIEEAQTEARNPTGRATTYTSTTDRGGRLRGDAHRQHRARGAWDRRVAGHLWPGRHRASHGVQHQRRACPDGRHRAGPCRRRQHPRANTTVDMNRIDFNDPVKNGAEIVAENLKAQG